MATKKLSETTRATAVTEDDLIVLVNAPASSPETKTAPADVLAQFVNAHNVVCNVLDPAYGAVGDGVTDDTAAIQAAINAGDVVIIPDGTYKITSRLTVNKAMTIRVEGTLATTRYLYEVTPIAIFYITADNVLIEGPGTLQGPGTFSHNVVADVLRIPSLIRVHQADDVTIRGLRFVDVPQTGIAFYESHGLCVRGNAFIGGDTVANCVADINYYAIHGYESDFAVIADNRFVDDASGNTFAEGIFIYGTDYTEITRNYFENIVDHDVYLYHSVGDLTGVNNHNVVSRNTSYSTLTNGTQKVGASFKVHGTFNDISANHIVNACSGIVLEGGAYSTIVDNNISGFNTEGIIVSDLVSPNALGLNYITIAHNTLQGAAAANTYGIYFRGDPTYSTANAVGGKILGNTIIRCGDTAGSAPSPIAVFHSLAPYFMDSFLIADNVLVAPQSVFGVYADRLRRSRLSGNIIKDGTYTGWRGFRLDTNCTFNTVSGNTVRDDQGTPLLSIGCNFGAASDTDNVVTGNVFHSLYASRSENPWSIDAALRITGDRNSNGDTLGYPVAVTTAEASASITASSSVVINTLVPAGARLLGVQLRVDTALTGGELWDAAYSGGSTATIATAQAVAKNTKVTLMFNANAATDITSATTNVTITKNGGGSFTALGKIRALVYYEMLTTLGDAA